MPENTQIEALTRRVEALENELAVRDVLMRYCLAADSGDAQAAALLFDQNCSVDIDAAVFMKGTAEVKASLESNAHQSMLPRVAHITGPFRIHVKGDHATATGYMTLFVKGESTAIARQSMGRWELEKRDGRWFIKNRIARSVGRPDTKDLITKSLAGI